MIVILRTMHTRGRVGSEITIDYDGGPEIFEEIFSSENYELRPCGLVLFDQAVLKPISVEKMNEFVLDKIFVAGFSNEFVLGETFASGFSIDFVVLYIDFSGDDVDGPKISCFSNDSYPVKYLEN